MKVLVNQIIKQLLNGLPDRQREVLELRYGLTRPETATLAEIGDKYGVTRERIRQLESLALRDVREVVSKTELPQFVKLVSEKLDSVGGVMKEDQLFLGLQPVVGGTPNALRFVLEISNAVFQHREDNHLHTFWYLNEDSKKKAASFIDKLHQSLQAKKDSLPAPTDSMSLNFVSVSKKFAVNPYGDFGLSEWAHIIPRNARDWAYLILKRNNKPLHFSEIAEAVTKLRGKKTNPQTVHNELIKYPEFVLVGKGTYALSEMGYQPGVAWEVINRLIKENGPLTSKQVVEKVLNERIFKENTILINLQNKKRFKRLPDGRYATLA
ncbi:MAG: sigma factor-like helix-turn-helix DNA-binding protein [Patescibacteria group bacterium]